MLSDLLQRGGLDSMMWTVSLILCALSFGGVMERLRVLEVLLEAILKHVESVDGIGHVRHHRCFATNLLVGDQ